MYMTRAGNHYLRGWFVVDFVASIPVSLPAFSYSHPHPEPLLKNIDACSSRGSLLSTKQSVLDKNLIKRN